MLLNLVVNANDALPDGGVISIGNRVADRVPAPLTSERRYVVLELTDNGIGMDHDTVAHIFEPFFTTKRESHGTGLGLATAYGIVAQHGGVIEVESALGVGSRFVIYLPTGDDETSLA